MSGSASTLMDVNDELSIERLVWVVYDGVLLPGKMPKLSGQHSWSQIIMGTFTLIYKGKKNCDHCHTCTTTSSNALQASRKARTPTLQSEVKVTPRVTSSYSGGGGMAASLNHYSEDGDHPFHQYHMSHVKYGSPKQTVAVPPCHMVTSLPAQKDHQVDALWRTRQWLEECEEKFVKDELVWWPLVCPLTDESNGAMYGLMQSMLAAWQWLVKTFTRTYGFRHQTIP